MTKRAIARPSGIASAADVPDAQAALRAMDTAHAGLRAETAALKREEAARGAREKKAVTAYLKGLERAGARLARLPVGAGVVSGQDAGRAATRRSLARPMTSSSLVAAIPGLADLDLPVFLPFATLTPPYAYEWTWTKVIYYAPGELSPYASRATGNFGFNISSSHDSNQVNKCRARAAIGISYRPTERGVLGIRPKVDVDWYWRLKWNMRVAHAYGWTGILVQSFDATTNEMLSAPVDKKRMEFDESGGGSVLPPVEITVNLPPEDFWGTSLFVDPRRWYAIWIWCGGGIRAAGWQTYLGMNVGSDATSKVDVSVPSIALYFSPLTAMSGSH